MDILNEIKTFINKYKLLNKGTHFLIGFSGGADSMLLLYYLKELRNEYGISISALHINHGWRGVESDNEEENCKKFCKKYSIPFYSEKLKSDIKKDENSARIARYEIFNNSNADVLPEAFLPTIPTVENTNSSSAISTNSYSLSSVLFLATGTKLISKSSSQFLKPVAITYKSFIFVSTFLKQ